jgi:hypothetical protein
MIRKCSWKKALNWIKSLKKQKKIRFGRGKLLGFATIRIDPESKAKFWQAVDINTNETHVYDIGAPLRIPPRLFDENVRLEIWEAR